MSIEARLRPLTARHSTPSRLLGAPGPTEGEVRALVEAGANTQLADRNGDTPLVLARARGYQAMVNILEKAGAK